MLKVCLVLPALVFWAAACSTEPFECGPREAVVRRVIDGDTVELASGERVRYLLVDTPESTGGTVECFGSEARDENRALVEGRRVSLRYDAECRDRYERLLARCRLDGDDIGAWLVRVGLAVSYGDYEREETTARKRKLGLWAGSFEWPSAWRQRNAPSGS